MALCTMTRPKSPLRDKRMAAGAVTSPHDLWARGNVHLTSAQGPSANPCPPGACPDEITARLQDALDVCRT